MSRRNFSGVDEGAGKVFKGHPSVIGWPFFLYKKLYAMGIIYIGSGLIRYEKTPAHAL